MRKIRKRIRNRKLKEFVTGKSKADKYISKLFEVFPNINLEKKKKITHAI